MKDETLGTLFVISLLVIVVGGGLWTVHEVDKTSAIAACKTLNLEMIEYRYGLVEKKVKCSDGNIWHVIEEYKDTCAGRDEWGDCQGWVRDTTYFMTKVSDNNNLNNAAQERK